jgi:hypothetical protein
MELSDASGRLVCTALPAQGSTTSPAHAGAGLAAGTRSQGDEVEARRVAITRGCREAPVHHLRGRGRAHEGGIRPSRLPALCPARLPARHPFVIGQDLTRSLLDPALAGAYARLTSCGKPPSAGVPCTQPCTQASAASGAPPRARRRRYLFDDLRGEPGVSRSLRLAGLRADVAGHALTGCRILYTCRAGRAELSPGARHRDGAVPDAPGARAPGKRRVPRSAVARRVRRPRRRAAPLPGDDRRSRGGVWLDRRDDRRDQSGKRA